MEMITIEDALELLSNHWKKQGISKNNPASLKDIKLFEKNHELILPDDFCLYFQVLNGMELKFPKEFDNEGFYFYSLKNVIPYEKEFGDFEPEFLKKDEKCLMFSDYMQKSWWYTVIIKESLNYKIGIIPEKGIFKEISESLPHFIKLYVDNSSLLYN